MEGTQFMNSLILVLIGYISKTGGQNMPVFLGQSTPPVPGQQFGPQYQMYLGQGAQPWAPGEPSWFFPSTRGQWMTSCQRLGCRGLGNHCVFWGSLCPSSVRRVPCRCQRGCRMDNVFIPFGESRVIDGCNNVCTCRSRSGQASCTTRRC